MPEQSMYPILDLNIKPKFQDVFDAGIAFAIKQGAPSTDGISCQYRNDAGLACLVGAFMTEEEAAWADRCGGCLEAVAARYPRFIHYNELFDALQSVHDNTQFELSGDFDGIDPTAWRAGIKKRAAAAALKLRLTYNP